MTNIVSLTKGGRIAILVGDVKKTGGLKWD